MKPEASALFNQLFPRFREVAHQHPLITGPLQTENFPVHKISDFLNQENYHRLELYQDVYRHLGVEYQISANIKLEPNRLTAFALSRRQADYTERDREVLELLRPHLVVAFNRLALAEECKNLHESADLSLKEFSSATIIVNPQGRVLYHVGPGLRWIGATRSGFLPAEINRWVKQDSQQKLRRNLHLSSVAGEVCIRAVPTTSAERILLVLTLDGVPSLDQAAKAYSLTPREKEVAHWICQGKTNAEIAIILGISPRTVHKHVENILARVGVESRVTLTVRLLEHRSPPKTG
jgi:DNA-binding CsgD family transcriptional regulator